MATDIRCDSGSSKLSISQCIWVSSKLLISKCFVIYIDSDSSKGIRINQTSINCRLIILIPTLVSTLIINCSIKFISKLTLPFDNPGTWLASQAVSPANQNNWGMWQSITTIKEYDNPRRQSRNVRDAHVQNIASNPLLSSSGFAYLLIFNTTLHPILDPMDIIEWSKVFSLTLQYQQWTRSRALLIFLRVLSGRLSENSHLSPPGAPRIVERTENGTKHCKTLFIQGRVSKTCLRNPPQIRKLFFWKKMCKPRIRNKKWPKNSWIWVFCRRVRHL